MTKLYFHRAHSPKHIHKHNSHLHHWQGNSHQHDHQQHAHSHDGGHHHHAPHQFNTAFIVATVINLLFVIAEVIYALLANSMSLLADAGHNFGDVIGLAMSGIALRLLKKRSSAKYSYGFRRTTIMAALLNAVLLIVTTIMIVFESVHKLFHPVAVQEGIVMVVAAIGMLVNGGTALFFMLLSKKPAKMI